jgi:hypothetical protein
MEAKEINKIAEALNEIEIEINTYPNFIGHNQEGEGVIRIGLSTDSAEDLRACGQTLGGVQLTVEEALLLVTNLSNQIRKAVKATK